MKQPVGICIIGAGRAGIIHGKSFSAGVPGARLIGFADPNTNALEDATSRFGLEASFSDYQKALAEDRIDAVVVVAPTVFHREIVVAAAQAGKHILCEKPMAMSEAECREMNEAADAAGVKLQIGFMRRFDASFRGAHDHVLAAAIGEVNQVKSLTHGPSVPQPWMLDIKKSNGPLAEVNSHDIDTVRWFGGADIEEVYAVGSNFRCRDRSEEYPEFYDTVLLLCRLANGVQGVIDGAVSVGYGYDARAEILGSDGIILVGSLKEDTVRLHARGGTMSAATVKSWRTLFKDAYVAEAASFVHAVCEDRPVEVTGHDGLQAVQVVNAGNESIRTGRPVTVGG